jgi:RecA-family ATPase
VSLRRLDIRAALQNAPRPIDFVLPGLPKGATGALVASGGTGKTTFGLQAAVSLALGLPVAGGAFPALEGPCKTALLAAEEDALLLCHRLHAIRDWLCERELLLPGGARLAREELVERLQANLLLYPAAGHEVRLLKHGTRTPLFDELCKRFRGAKLVLLDPVRRLHDGNENDSGDMTAVVEVGERLAQTVNAAVVFVHHTSKAATLNGFSDQQSAGRGSSALTDGVRWQCNLAGMSAEEAASKGLENDRRFLVRLEISKANYIPPFPTTWLRRLRGGVLTKVDSLAPPSPPSKRPAARQREVRHV